MPRVDSGVSIAIYNEHNVPVWSNVFATKWKSSAELTGVSEAFFRDKIQSLSTTSFPVREEFTQLFQSMQEAMLSTKRLSFSKASGVIDSVQMTNGMSCEVRYEHQVSDAASQLAVYAGNVGVSYRLDSVWKKLNLDAPALCCHFTRDNRTVVLNSYSCPERRTESTWKPASVTEVPLQQLDAVFSQHFIVTQNALYKQAPVRRVLAGRDFNRSLPCLPRHRSHRDARRLAKAEHEAVRRACGFSDTAWKASELSCTPRFSVWVTPHASAGVHVASVFVH